MSKPKNARGQTPHVGRKQSNCRGYRVEAIETIDLAPLATGEAVERIPVDGCTVIEMAPEAVQCDHPAFRAWYARNVAVNVREAAYG